MASPNTTTPYIYDGILDTGGGMNSGVEPQKLDKDELAYISNGFVGTSFLTNRPPFNQMAITAADEGTLVAATKGYFYGACIYKSDAGVTSIMASIGGSLFRFTPLYDVLGNPLNQIFVDNQSAAGQVMDTSPLTTQHWLEQAERWVVWGDGKNLPYYWDGSATPPTIRQSLGPVSNELPIGKMMAYGLGQLWMALPDGQSFMFGDYIGMASGTLAYNFRDSVLKSSMNNSLANGGNFRVPANIGSITGFRFTSLLDNTLGTGPLQVFTQLSVQGCIAPITTTNLSTITSPILTESLKAAGGVSGDSCINANGDIFFRSQDGQIRSLLMSRRDFLRWGNTPVSFEVGYFLTDDPQQLLYYDSGVNFNNEMLMLCNPVIGALGVYHEGITSLSFDQVSGIKEKQEPCWNGLWQGPNLIKIVTGMFNNIQRCFAFVFNSTTNSIEIHELLTTSATQFMDSNQTPITMQFVSGALFWKFEGKSEFDLIRLQGGEMAVQEIQGVVKFTVEFKSVYDQTWHPWYSWTVDNTNGNNSYKPRMGLGKPPVTANSNPSTNRPFEVDYSFQFRVTIQGSCKFMGLRLAATLEPHTELARPFPSST